MQKNDLDPTITVDPFTKHFAHTLRERESGGDRDNVRERETFRGGFSGVCKVSKPTWRINPRLTGTQLKTSTYGEPCRSHSSHSSVVLSPNTRVSIRLVSSLLVSALPTRLWDCHSPREAEAELHYLVSRQ